MVACEQDDICDHGYPTHLRNPRLLAKENDASSDISSGLINVQEFIPPFDTGLGGNYKADQGVQTSDNKISLIALVLIGIPLSVATVIVDIGLVAGEIALISSSIVVPELAPVIVPLGLVLAGTGLVITDLDLSYWVFTYRVASAPEGEPVNFEILLPWNKDE